MTRIEFAVIGYVFMVILGLSYGLPLKKAVIWPWLFWRVLRGDLNDKRR